MVLSGKNMVATAATVLLAATMSLAQTESHPKPVKHKAPKAEKHQAPKATRHAAPKATQHKAHAATKHPGPKVSKKRARGQQAIDTERASQIQQALVREHYMNGSPSGTWDNSTQEAMRRYQADHGWQSKTVPDSRALIRLGLGPDHEHLLNPESAMISEPQAQRAEPVRQGTSGGGSNAVVTARSSSSMSAPSSVINPAVINPAR